MLNHFFRHHNKACLLAQKGAARNLIFLAAFLSVIFSTELYAAIGPNEIENVNSLPAKTHSISAEQTKDALFLALKNAPDAVAAKTYVDEIWRLWFISGNQAVDDLMRSAMQKRRNYDFAGAIEVLDKIIDLKPDYAEGWNQRATMYFMQQNYERSLQDIAKTLELEPRHFGALSGRTMIRINQFKRPLALQNMVEALKINPFLPERALFPSLMKP